MDAELILLESIVVAIITACATVLAVMVTEVLFGKTTFQLLKNYVDESGSSKTEVLNSFAAHYQGLTAEHKKILALQESLKEQAEKTVALVGSTGKDLSKEVRFVHSDMSKEVQKIYVGMREEKIEQRNRYENLTDHQWAIADSISTLSAVSEEMQKLSSRNIELKAENEKLQTECDRLNAQVEVLAKDNREWDKRYDALIDEANKQIARRDDELERLKNPHRDRDIDVDR